ncbi:hypothetical protein [Acinetobacter sp. NEB 394]|jgi:hypothetical protein|uniref:hypothetical protein n=1 Tax=Acinetobacter sp. NEB 394 TaxID=2743575 RepID=UPI0015970BE2|nr:hypothetical protein [Acinetobacter sp. NEB 394]QKY92440.1 hypothetical protein HUK62_18725 [Acinetobacter sp. NEB 394]
MKIMMTEDDQEREIAEAAARVLHDSFIEAAQTGPVFYVENDVLMSKSPNQLPVVIKRLFRNLELSKRVPKQGTVKIRKKDIKCGLR